MTNEELFDDLRQFITTTVAQSEERLRGEMAAKGDLEGLATKVDLVAVEKSILHGVGDAMSHVNEEVDKQLDDHEVRLGRLEHRAE